MREVTKREILFSTIILAVMMGIGVWISNPIITSTTENALQVVSAVKVFDAEKFGYIKRTDVGEFYAEGKLIANDVVRLEELPGTYSRVEKVKEEYEMHTETYTTTDSKGHTQTHTRTYYSWDVKDRKNFESESFTFFDTKFRGKEIGYRPATRHDTIIYNRKFWGNDIRYVYYTTPVVVEGVLYGVADGKRYKDLKFSRDRKIEKIVKTAEGNIKSAPIIFWVGWIFLTALLIGGFYAAENRWLY